MLDLAGVLAGDVRRNAELYEEVRKDLVPGVDLLGDLHSGGGEGVLPRTLVVENDYLFVAVGLVFQRDIVVHRLHKTVEPFGDGINLLQAVVGETVGKKHVRPYGTVNFGHHNALREETTTHAHLVGLPLLGKLRHI